MRVSLNGYVVPTDEQWLYDWFGYEAFSPGVVRKALADNPDGEDLEVEINSPGGSVFAGFEMYSLLREAKCNTVAIVQSLAGSAASTVMAGCRTVRMSPVAQVMVHLPSGYAEGDQNTMRHEAKVLESITQSILNGYEAKCGNKASRETLDKLIRAESWLTAREAVELGLADSIIGQEKDSPVPEGILDAAGAGIRAVMNAAGTPPNVGKLLARYEALVREGAAPAEGHPVGVPVGSDAHAPVARGRTTTTDDRRTGASPMSEALPPEGRGQDPVMDDWRTKARLNIERQRFNNIILGGTRT